MKLMINRFLIAPTFISTFLSQRKVPFQKQVYMYISMYNPSSFLLGLSN